MAGPSGAVSNYLAFGTSMDWMYVRQGVKYPLTLEVYGGHGEGKLKGELCIVLRNWKKVFTYSH